MLSICGILRFFFGSSLIDLSLGIAFDPDGRLEAMTIVLLYFFLFGILTIAPAAIAASSIVAIPSESVSHYDSSMILASRAALSAKFESTSLPSSETPKISPGDTVLTHGFNCSSLVMQPLSNWHINSSTLSAQHSDGSSLQSARASCLAAAMSTCLDFTLEASDSQGQYIRNVWYNNTEGQCWVGIFYPENTTGPLPSYSQCLQDIFEPMINTCVNQTSGSASGPDSDLTTPYDEGSYNLNPLFPHSITSAPGHGFVYDLHWPGYLVMSTKEAEVFSSIADAALADAEGPPVEATASYD